MDRSTLIDLSMTTNEKVFYSQKNVLNYNL